MFGKVSLNPMLSAPAFPLFLIVPTPKLVLLVNEQLLTVTNGVL